MNKSTAPAPETTGTGPVEQPSHPAPLVLASLDESALGDLVTLWTDWDRTGTNFPAEYLPQVIAALQAIQARIG
ncbi:hypothetical protein [Paeniglutamicibacter sp.]|uniref:hypothetical protein n=1 Tax=Paeniglutamicibacter sp. TaxID=1934391 RepID=UPI00398955BD